MTGEKSSIFTYSHNVSKAAENSLIWNTVGCYIWNILSVCGSIALKIFSFFGCLTKLDYSSFLYKT
jgi:hypothetical protein